MIFAAAAARAASTIRRCASHHHPFFRGRRFSTVNGGSGGRAGVPWLLLSSPDNPESRYLYNLVKDDKYGRNTIERHRELSLPEIAGSDFIGSSHGFLFTKPTEHNTNIRAINPLTGDQLRLPPCDPIHRCKEVDDFFMRAKAILSPSCDSAVLLTPYRGLRVPLFARLDAAASSSWTPVPDCFPVENGINMILDDLIFHKGRLHVVNWNGNLGVYDEDKDSSSFSFSVVCSSDIDVDAYDFYKNRTIYMYLVESPDGDDLLLLIREWDYYLDYWYRTWAFRVFKLHCNINGDYGSGCKWKEVDNLGDAAVFLGSNHAVSLSASNFPALKPNAIYFTDDSFQDTHGTDTGVFYLEDGSFDFFDTISTGDNPPCPLPIWLETVAAS